MALLSNKRNHEARRQVQPLLAQDLFRKPPDGDMHLGQAAIVFAINFLVHQWYSSKALFLISKALARAKAPPRKCLWRCRFPAVPHVVLMFGKKAKTDGTAVEGAESNRIRLTTLALVNWIHEE